MLGLSSFQVVAVQFGTDQLQDAPSDHLSAFVFWYFMIEIILDTLTQWIFYLLSLSENKNVTGRIPLALSLLGALLFSVALSIKSCYMSEWFSKDNTTSNRGLKSSNPYRLIYRVLKFAKEHKCPVQRSALTYWENEIPSRINLGKRKYGGPFTTEEVEDVKTFLQLFKLLLSLVGIVVFSFSINTVTDAPKGHFLISALCHTASVCFLILARALFSHFCKHYLSMLKRIGIGSVLTFACASYILLINCLEYTTSISGRYVIYLNLVIPTVLFDISYIVLTVSFLEFIIAQSPHPMKGLLIGMFYVIRYGVGGLLALVVQQLPCTYLHSAISCSGIVSYALITIFALVSGIVYSIVACKYRLRERDEVVNVHIFAEEYYEKRDDSNTYSDVDQDA
jgi:peptide/histidine transporter 3/4